MRPLRIATLLPFFLASPATAGTLAGGPVTVDGTVARIAQCLVVNVGKKAIEVEATLYDGEGVELSSETVSVEPQAERGTTYVPQAATPFGASCVARFKGSARNVRGVVQAVTLAFEVISTTPLR